jgi:hypothetical protein
MSQFSYDYFPSTERREPFHQLSNIKQKNNFSMDEGLQVTGGLSSRGTDLEGGRRRIKSEERVAKLALLYLNRSGSEASFGNLARRAV